MMLLCLFFISLLKIFSDDKEKSHKIVQLDFVKRNNIDGLNIIFKFTDFFFKKIGSNLNQQVHNISIGQHLFTLSSSTTQPIWSFLTPKATGRNFAKNKTFICIHNHSFHAYIVPKQDHQLRLILQIFP